MTAGPPSSRPPTPAVKRSPRHAALRLQALADAMAGWPDAERTLLVELLERLVAETEAAEVPAARSLVTS